MRKKQLLSILLSLALIVGMIPAFGVIANAAQINSPTGYWYGDSVQWKRVNNAENYTIYIIQDLDGSSMTQVIANIPVDSGGALKSGASAFITIGGQNKNIDDLVTYDNSTGYYSFKYNELFAIISMAQYRLCMSANNSESTSSLFTNSETLTGTQLKEGYYQNKESTIEPTHVVNVSAVNVRESPDSDSKRIGGLTEGKSVTVVYADEEWSAIIYGDAFGWVPSKYLTPINAEDNIFKDFYVYVTPPVAGQHPQAPTVKTDKYSVSAYNWIRITSDGATKMKDSEVFEGGEGVVYQIRADLALKDGKVGQEEELTAYVNDSAKTPEGKAVETMRLSYSKVKVMADFKCASVLTNPFVDVYETDEYYNAVLWAYYASPQITNGTDATHFSPKNTVKRCESVTFLWRAMGCPEPKSTYNPFKDVKTSDYFYKPVLWAVENNITNGIDATHFDPNGTLTTAHMITFLYRTKNPGKNGWYEEAANWAGNGYSGKPFGVNTVVNNSTNCPRGYVVMFLQKAK